MIISTVSGKSEGMFNSWIPFTKISTICVYVTLAKYMRIEENERTIYSLYILKIAC